MRAIRVGDPLDPATEMGPLISAGQREAVASFLDDGDPVVARGSAPDGPGLLVRADGPRARSRDARVMREEVFGPIVAVVPFRDEEDAIALANDTDLRPLGIDLDPRRRARAARRARRSRPACSRSTRNSSVRVSTPFGGFKQSGYGRELGPHALDAYTEVKTIYYATS